MTVTISRLRMWFAIAAILMITVVAGAYFYAKWRVENALKEVPGKIGIEIRQSAEGFTISKSEGSHTLFTIQASKAIEYKKGLIAELHKVNITIYGEDSSRYDQIYGDDFAYDPQSGDVTAKGEVQIDLEANPAGIASPDQSIPQELKNPIHLKTSGLVFNQKTGNGYTNAKIEFEIPQASGSAMGADYQAKTGVLTLHSQIQVTTNGDQESHIVAAKAIISKNPRNVTLEHVHATSDGKTSDADKVDLFLKENNTVERAQASGNVHVHDEDEGKSKQAADLRANQLNLQMNSRGKGLLSAVFTGNVEMTSVSDQKGSVQQMHMSSGRATLKFTGKDTLTSIHADENVRVLEHQDPEQNKNGQDVELAAPAMDFVVSNGRLLQRAETFGAPQIAIQEILAKPAQSAHPQHTVITAGKFAAQFNDAGQLTLVHGEPYARIVVSTQGQPDRVSTSNTLDVSFRPGNGITSLMQQGSLVYSDKDQKAWADRGQYTAADQMLVLTESPRVEGNSMSASAQTIRLNRATGDAIAEGDVKTTYTDMKPQANGALLASSSPIHVTAQKMTVHKTPSVALFSGSARLWQDANVVQANSIQFDRDHRSVQASGINGSLVSTVLVQADKAGRITPITITSKKLQYVDSERQIHFGEGVTADGSDMKLTADHMDVFLAAQNAKPVVGNGTKEGAQRGKIEKIVATGGVLLTQPGRQASGEQLTYTLADDKFVLNGNSPSIFDAEHGKITGVSLTFFRHDDRVQVEGSTQFPAVTHTQMAR
jgi:lipopolysaccharide export system protein LptA